MQDEASAKKAQPPLVDSILQNGKQAFDPEIPWELRKANVPTFSSLLESTSTLALMPVLNLLVQPDRAQPWLRTPLISALARLPLRPRGVQHTIEFILSVHPSSAGSSAGIGRGSSISHEALNAASRLLSSPPVSMSPEKWFYGIAPQLFSLLEGEGEPEMDKAIAFVIGFGILGRKQFGAPGMPGWKALVEPILASIDPTISPTMRSNRQPPNEIETLGSREILVAGPEVSKGLQRLSTLLTSHPHPSLTKRLLHPILLPLWSLSYWPRRNDYTERCYRKPAGKLLRTLLQLSPSTKDSKKTVQSGPSLLLVILQNLTFQGRSSKNEKSWLYSTAKDGGIQIEDATRGEFDNTSDNILNLARVDIAVDAFIDLLQTLPDLKSDISELFINLCTKWLTHGTKDQETSVVISLEAKSDKEDVKNRLIEAKVMQKMMTAFPEKLVEDSTQVLDLVSQILSDFTFATNSGSGSEDTVAVALSLLSIVLTSQSFQVTSGNGGLLKSIQSSLSSIGKKTQLEISSTAQNLLLLLKYRSTFEEPAAANMSTPTDRQLEDRKTYSLAMAYLTGADSPPPVRAQGLELISNLIRTSSPIIDIPALLVLFSSLLQDSDEYIYLRAIQSFIQLSQKHPKAVTKDLIDRYVDPSEECELDQRLRLGEALLQVMENNSASFTGDSSRAVCVGLLFIASRRGYRPKTEEQQGKKNKLKRKQDNEAEEAWGGPVPQLDEVFDVKAQEDNEILSQIVVGWESKRGSEDVRIRASALSILGSGIEANVAGIEPKTISAAVDLSIHVLTLEPEPEKGILRRTAILLIMSLVRALDTTRVQGKKLAFGFAGQSLEDVQRILKYVEASDNDGLVRQHARDVIEGLRAWQINALLPPQREQTEIQELAGLSIHPRDEEGSSGKARPRIQEVE